MGVLDVKVVSHIYTLLLFFPVFPLPRETRDGRFFTLSFFICFTFASAHRTVIKRFGNMFRQVIIRAGADSGRSKTSSINSASAVNRCYAVGRTAGKRKTRALHQHENGGVLLYCYYYYYTISLHVHYYNMLCIGMQRKAENEQR